MNRIRVLLVEGELSDARFVQEALSELEETTHGGAWIHSRVTHVERLDEALTMLGDEPPDIVLFSPQLGDSFGMGTFTALRDAAPGVPLVALLEVGEEGLGRRMLREGGQAYLLKGEVDCGPLARTIMNAIERHRFVCAAFRCIQTDLETGLPNGAAFEQASVREAMLADECGRSLTLLMAEIDNLGELDGACGRTAVHNTVVQAANTLRSAVGESALLARTGPGTFAVLNWTDSPDELISRVQSRLECEHQQFAFVFGHAGVYPRSPTPIAGAMSTATKMLCENKLAYSDLP